MWIGVDVGYRKIAVSCPRAGWVTSIDFPAKKNVGRRQEVQKLASFMSDVVKMMYIDKPSWSYKAVIEAPVVAGARNLQSTIKVAKTVGLVEALLAPHVMEIHAVAVSSWKSKVVGHGHASKEDVVKWVDSHLPEMTGLCEGNQDLHDATCIALYGETLD